MSDNNNILSRDAFFAACKARMVTSADIQGWGRVNIRKLTLGQLRLFDEAKDNYERAKMLIFESIVDGNSKQIFQSLEEVDELEMPLFKALSEAVSDVNALKPVSEDELKNSVTAKSYVLN